MHMVGIRGPLHCLQSLLARVDLERVKTGFAGKTRVQNCVNTKFHVDTKFQVPVCFTPTNKSFGISPSIICHVVRRSMKFFYCLFFFFCFLSYNSFLFYFDSLN